MKKKIKGLLGILVATTMLFSGCGDSGTTTSSSSDSTTTTTSASVNPGEGAETVGIILVGTRDDYGYNQGLYELSRRLEEELGLNVMVKESVPEDSSVQAVTEQMIAQNCKIVLAGSYGHLEYVEEVAKNYPDVAFFTTNPNGQGLDNVSCITSDQWDAAYVNGVAAGLTTTSNQLGYIASFQIPTVISSINAFALGAQSVNPDAQVHAVFTGSWSDVGLQTNAINGMASQNIDTIAQYQDYTKTIVETCESQGINVIGHYVNTIELAPNTYISGSMNVYDNHLNIFEAAINGDFENIVHRGGYDKGMIGNSEGADFVSAEIKSQVSSVIEAMKSGEFTAFTGPIYKQDGTLLIDDGEVLSYDDVDSMDYFVQGVAGSTN